MLERAKQEGRFKDDSLRKLEENLQNLETKAKGKEQLCKNLQEKVKELEGQLDSKAHSQITSEKQQRQLSGKLKEKEEMCTALQQKVQVKVVTVVYIQEHDRSAVELKIKELELRLKEQEHQRSVAELKNKELLELKLKEQEHQRSVAELKAREIGHELLETQRTEAMLQIKLRDLESKTKVQETNMTLDSAIATPREAKLPPFSREEAMSEREGEAHLKEPEFPEQASASQRELFCSRAYQWQCGRKDGEFPIDDGAQDDDVPESLDATSDGQTTC